MFFILCLIPISLSFICIAAHFLRHGPVSLAILAIVLPIVFLNIRQNTARRAIQLLLMAAIYQWYRTIALIIQERNLEQRSWTASAIILGTVMLLTLFSALLLELPVFRRRFQGDESVLEDKPEPESQD